MSRKLTLITASLAAAAVGLTSTSTANAESSFAPEKGCKTPKKTKGFIKDKNDRLIEDEFGYLTERYKTVYKVKRGKATKVTTIKNEGVVIYKQKTDYRASRKGETTVVASGTSYYACAKGPGTKQRVAFTGSVSDQNTMQFSHDKLISAKGESGTNKRTFHAKSGYVAVAVAKEDVYDTDDELHHPEVDITNLNNGDRASNGFFGSNEIPTRIAIGPEGRLLSSHSGENADYIIYSQTDKKKPEPKLIGRSSTVEELSFQNANDDDETVPVNDALSNVPTWKTSDGKLHTVNNPDAVPNFFGKKTEKCTLYNSRVQNTPNLSQVLYMNDKYIVYRGESREAVDPHGPYACDYQQNVKYKAPISCAFVDVSSIDHAQDSGTDTVIFGCERPKRDSVLCKPEAGYKLHCPAEVGTRETYSWNLQTQALTLLSTTEI